MTEHENTGVVQRAYQSVGRGDIPGLLNLMAADVEWWLPQMEHVPFSGVWHGRKGVQDFFAAVAASQDVLEFAPEQFIAQGDNVVVLGSFAMHVKSTDRISRAHWAHVWTFRHGQIVHFREYVDTAAVSAAHRPGA